MSVFTSQGDAFVDAVTEWLETVMIAPAAHIAVIEASSSALLAAGSVLNIPVASAVSIVSNALGDVGKFLLPDLLNPNIEGIPISSAKVTDSRESEVSEVPLIMQQADSRKKTYNTDNVVPRLMEWNIDGYITSFNDLNKTKGWPLSVPRTDPEAGMSIKLTLVLQEEYLDACQLSRKPVWFKTPNSKFKLVQIINKQVDSEATNNNGKHISITLREFNPYIMDELSPSGFVADDLSEQGFPGSRVGGEMV